MICRPFVRGILSVCGLVPSIIGCIASDVGGGGGPISRGFEPLPEISMENPLLLEYDRGELRFEIASERASYFKERDAIEISSVSGRFWGGEEGVWYVRGGRGRIDRGTSDVEMEGDVRIWSENGMELRTDSMIYRSADHRIETEDRVWWRGEKLISESLGAVLYLDSQQLSFPGGVHARIEEGAVFDE